MEITGFFQCCDTLTKYWRNNYVQKARIETTTLKNKQREQVADGTAGSAVWVGLHVYCVIYEISNQQYIFY